MEKIVVNDNLNSKEKIRSSNIELLRILAIIMIILHHITLHCFNYQLTLHGKGVFFNNPLFYKKLLVPQTFLSLGKIGNIIFILISGYFLINKKINVVKQIKKILYQIIFVIPILVIISYLYYKFFSHNFIGIQNFYSFNTDYWFIGFYIGIIIFADLFLNKFLNKLDKTQYMYFLLVMFSIISIAFTRNIISDISNGLVIFFSGIFVYSLGGFIKIYNPFKNVRIITFIFAIILSFVLIWISFYNNTLVNINNAKNNTTEVFHQSLNSLEEYSIFCIIIGISLFEIFKRIKIKNSRIINYIASSTFMIYLIHDNNFVRKIWRESDWVRTCYTNILRYILEHILFVTLIIIIGVIAFSLYNFTTKLLSKNIIRNIFFKKLTESDVQEIKIDETTKV